MAPTVLPANMRAGVSPSTMQSPLQQAQPVWGFKSVDEIAREERDSASKNKQLASDGVSDALAAYLKEAFRVAVDHRDSVSGITGKSITSRLEDCARRRAGVYSDDKLTKIHQVGGSDIYHNNTDEKCESAAAFLMDVLDPSGDQLFSCKPTPKPDLPDIIRTQVINQTIQKFQEFQGEYTNQEVMEFALDLYDGIVAEEQRIATECAERKEVRIKDQLEEGEFRKALAEFIDYMVSYLTAIMVRSVHPQRRLSWGADLGAVITTENVTVWETINPFDFYPGPNCSNAQDGYLTWRIRWDRSALAEMKGAVGWDAKKIDAVLADPPASGAPSLNGDAERRELENKPLDDARNDKVNPMLEGFMYWGNVEGKLLKEWGVKDIEDETKFYAINAVQFGDYTVKAILNPDPLGRRPVYITSWRKVAGSIWGTCPPEIMADCQDAYTAAWRHALNNMAGASGSDTIIDVSVVDQTSVDVAISGIPKKVLTYNGSALGGSSRPPIDHYQPQDNSTKCLEIARVADDTSDNRTGILKYFNGDGNVAGAGQTSSGLSMLMKMATRRMKKVLLNIDTDVLKPAIIDQHNWNMMHDEVYREIGGDIRIVPKGILATLVQDVVQMRRNEVLQTLRGDQKAQAIIGDDGYSELLRAIFKELNLPAGDIVPSKEVLARRMKMVQEQMAAAQASEAGQPGLAEPAAQVPPPSEYQPPVEGQ